MKLRWMDISDILMLCVVPCNALDKEAPVFTNCPTGVEYVLKYSSVGITPSWEDNSGAIEKITSSPAFNELIDKDQVITWEATDYGGNVGNCTFNVSLQIEVEPRFPNGCHEPVYIYYTKDGEVPVSNYNVSSEPGAPGFRPTKNTFEPTSFTVNKAVINKAYTLKQIATDEFDNKATCVFQAVVKYSNCSQEEFQQRKPANGVVTIKGDKATVDCNFGHAFYGLKTSSIEYTCTSGVYNSTTVGTYVPQCVVVRKPDHLQVIELQYASTDTSLKFTRESTSLYEKNFLSKIPTTVTKLMETAACSSVPIEITNVTSEGSIEKITLYFDVTYTNADTSIIRACKSDTNRYFVGNDVFPLSTLQPAGYQVVDKIAGSYSNDTFYCNNQEVRQNVTLSNGDEERCLPCPEGYYQSGSMCTKCGVGEFQNMTAQTQCFACPSGTSTYDMGATSEQQCYAMCPPPLISTNGLAPCTACPKGQYWVNANTCTACANGTTRGQHGAVSASQCTEPCPLGSFSHDGEGPSCRQCPLGYYSNAANSTMCSRCAPTTTTQELGSNSSTYCVNNATACSQNNPCKNGATCQVTNSIVSCLCPTGYNGTSCETEVNMCDSQPCFYGGTCTPFYNGYNCTCAPFPVTVMVRKVGLPNGYEEITLPQSTEDKCKTKCKEDNSCQISVLETTKQECRIYYTATTIYDTTATNYISFEKTKNYSMKFYEGKSCEIEPNECPTDSTDPDYCQNGGGCQDLFQGFKCLCRTNEIFTGRTCSESIPVCEKANCTNGGTCVAISNIRYACDCPPGYTGAQCETDIDECSSVPCLYGGTCTNEINGYSCNCIADFTGSQCEIRPADLCGKNPCGTIGTCVEDYMKSAPLCVCEAGYTSGEYWSTWKSVDTPEGFGDIESINSHGVGIVCHGNAVIGADCRVIDTKVSFTDTGEVGICNKDGFECYNNNQTNANCSDYEVRFRCQVNGQSCRDIDECTAEHCQNGAVCQDTTKKADPYQCSCAAGYNGFNCQRNTDECINSPCQNDGTCTDKVNGYMCACLDGYTGVNCEKNIDECSSNPCVNGRCEDGVNGYKCLCTSGYGGHNCSEDIDECLSQPCLHNGNCTDKLNGFVCSCEPGWAGARCENIVKYCTAGSCVKGDCFEVFQDYFCACSIGFRGRDCSIGEDICKVADPCLNGATCKDVKGNPECTPCPNDYVGDGCQCSKDYCKAMPCKNEGSCVAQLNSYTCQCPQGTTGQHCESLVNSCAGVNCGPGKCVAGLDKAFCVCPYNKQGNQCEKDVDRGFEVVMSSLASIGLEQPVVMNTTTFTLGAWVKYNTNKGTGNILSLHSTKSLTSSKAEQSVLTLDHSGLSLGKSSPQSVSYVTVVNDGQWHYVAVTVDTTTKEVSLYVDPFSSKDTISTSFELPEFGVLKLGGLDGSLSLVQMWTQVLNASTIQALFNAQGIDMTIKLRERLIIDWSWASYSTGISVHRLMNTSRGKIICDPGYKVEVNTTNQVQSCKLVRDKMLPPVVGCPTSIPTKLPLDGQRAITFNQSDGWNADSIFPGLEKSSNYNPGDSFGTGVHEVIYNGYDSNKNRATCKFKIVVKLSNCQVEQSGVPNCDTNKCEFLCAANQAKVKKLPNVLKCSQAGVYNIKNPLLKYKVPSCGALIKGSKKKITFGWVYNGNIGFSQSTLNTLKEQLVVQIKSWSSTTNPNFCHDAACSNLIITISPLSVTGKARVNIVASDIDNTINGLDVYVLLQQTVLQSNSFLIPSFKGLIIDASTYTIVEELSCSAPYQAFGENCVRCPQGTYYDNSTSVCQSCPVGQYQDTEGMFECNMCGVTNTTEDVGATAASECYEVCSPGYKYDKGVCTACGLGFYQPQSGKTYCLPCESGKITNENNATLGSQCYDLCNDGYRLRPDGNCELCPNGTYRVRGESQDCKNCPAGYTTPTAGSTTMSQCTVKICPAGQFVEGDQCLNCPEHTYRSLDLANCTQCPVSTRTDGPAAMSSSMCKFYCEAGSYISNSTGTPVCLVCPRDTYKVASPVSKLYATMCDNCTASKPRTSGTGSTTLDECRYGYCGAGEVANSSDPAKCVKCPYDTYQANPDPVYNVDNCTLCPVSTGTDMMGANSTAQCKLLCPSGESNNGSACVACDQGYYKDNSEGISEKFGSCKICPDPLLITNGTGAQSVAECNVGNCTAGQYLDTDKKCKPCSVDTFQTEKWQTQCTACPVGSKTGSVTGATQISQCNNWGATTQRFVFRVQVQYTFLVEYRNPLSTLYQTFVTDFITQATVFFQARITGLKTGTFGIKVLSLSNGSVITGGQLLVDTTKNSNPQPQVNNAIQDAINTKLIGTLPVGAQTVYIGTTNVCNPGDKMNFASGQCEACGYGLYQPTGGAILCLACDPGYNTSSTGSTAATDCKRYCPAGQQASGSACTPCPSGYAKAGDGIHQCTACSNGYITYPNDKTVCRIPCGAGTYNKLNTSSTPVGDTCEQCAMGYYSSGTNQVSCTKCADNGVTDSAGKTLSSACKNPCALDATYCGTGTCIQSGLKATCDCGTYYTGANCETRQEVSDSTTAIIIGVVVGATMLLLAGVAIFTYCYKTRSRLENIDEMDKTRKSQSRQRKNETAQMLDNSYGADPNMYPSTMGYYPNPAFSPGMGYYPTYAPQATQVYNGGYPYFSNGANGANGHSNMMYNEDDQNDFFGPGSSIGHSQNPYNMQATFQRS